MAVSRTLLVSGLVSLTVLGTVGGWIATGWPSVRAEAQAVREAPALRAAGQTRALSAELSARLESLRAGETERPYYHYGNLFHDPRGASTGLAVAPSPLARGPEDRLVAAHFQIGTDGRVTMPTVNPDVPELSEPIALSDNLVLLAQLSEVALELQGRGPRIARADSKQAMGQLQVPASPQVQSIDPQVYLQNTAANQVFQQVRRPAKKLVLVPPGAAPASPVRIATGGLSWRSVVVDGAPRLMALRRVETPDGDLLQGLLVDDAAVEAWLHARDSGSKLLVSPDQADEQPSVAVEASGGAWRVTIDPSVQVLAAADLSASMESGFWLRVVPISLAAALCGFFVVLTVARAESLARQRSQFAAAAAHELRTPLAGLQLYGEMLADGLGDPERASAYGRRVSDEAARLGRVVANVLGFTQLERGALTVEAVPGDAAVAARSAIDRARPALEHAGVELRVELPAELPARFDDDAVQRILSNLLDNAEKYTRDREARVITVSGRVGGGMIKLCVSDNGAGVPEPIASSLFSSFRRGASDDGPAGLGLGLALSRALARHQHGELSYRQAELGGAVFTLRLPS